MNSNPDGKPDSTSSHPDISDEAAAEMMRQAISDSDSPDSGAAKWEPPLPEELAPLLDGYTITSLLGKGGMGAVYRGVQESLDREVAIKLLPPELGSNAEFEARFQREAKSMARLNHPNIVQIFDYGQTSEGHHYIVMEFVDGTDLYHLIQSGGLTPDGALNAISQICDALEYAHSQGFVHRDIKPANMFINSSGTLKVGDFGLAKLVKGKTEREELGLTMTGVAMGTPHYIAPEQLDEGAAVDQRADIYSLGIMFYEMLTGEIPRGAVKSPSEKLKSIDVRIDGVVFKAMESDPGERYQSATDLRSDVDGIRTPVAPPADSSPDHPETAPPSPRKRVNRGAVTALIAIPVLLAVTLLFLSQRKPVEKSSQSSALAAPVSIPRAEGGLLRGLVYDQKSGQVMPLSFPSGWKHQKFHVIGATRGTNPGSAETAFSWWAINEEGLLGYTENGKSRVGMPTVAAKFQRFDHSIGVTLDGKLVVEPDSRFYPPPSGSGFVDVEVGNNFAIALTEKGQAHLWPASTHDQQLVFPPAQLLQKVVAISASHTNASLLSEEGRVTVWNVGKGPLANQLNGNNDVTKINNSLSLNKDGTLNSLNYRYLQFDNKITDFHNGGELLSVKLDTGEWKIMQRTGSTSAGARAIVDAFNAISNDRIINLIVEAPGGYGPAITIWTEREGNASSGNPAELKFPAAKSAPPTATVIGEASKETPYTNTIGMQFVPVPINRGPASGQTLLFSIWETRVSDYQKFISENPGISWLKPDFPQTGEHPAVRIEWENAVAFCNWLTERDRESGKLSKGEIYRLPGDYEWSCAAGIGHLEDPDTTPESKECRIPDLYPWGNQLPPPEDTDNFYGMETTGDPVKTANGEGFRKPLPGYRDKFARTSPVGSFTANSYGLFDLSGNASEWCSDWFSQKEERKTLRGGSWGTSIGHSLLSSARIANAGTVRFDTHGFRCVIAPVKDLD
ncbi:MAG: bifunctional serine/threonine-protein kinase/formylglycine-generating enzyme family protein [Verrucomicrobiales bacterium]|nr:bifunctional serine/threonine-protein kinase/formylglycine-generating enzyme family protein [Verrucomicrobiales bacterium]